MSPNCSTYLLLLLVFCRFPKKKPPSWNCRMGKGSLGGHTVHFRGAKFLFRDATPFCPLVAALRSVQRHPVFYSLSADGVKTFFLVIKLQREEIYEMLDCKFYVFNWQVASLASCSCQRWSPWVRPWPRGQPRGHISKFLALASKPQVLENCPVLGSMTALFFVRLKSCWKKPDIARKICENLFCFRQWRSPEKFYYYYYWWAAVQTNLLPLGKVHLRIAYRPSAVARQTRRHGGHTGAVAPKWLLVPPQTKTVPPKRGLYPKEINRIGATGVQIEAQIGVFLWTDNGFHDVFGMKTFFFGDYRFSADKIAWICDFRRKIPCNFSENLFLFCFLEITCFSAGKSAWICDFGRKIPLNLCFSPCSVDPDWNKFLVPPRPSRIHTK